MLYNIDPLETQYGDMRRGSLFDNRIQAALRIGDMKILTGTPLGGGYYPPISTDGK